MTRERMDKAAKKAAKVEAMWGSSVEDRNWQIRENCELCGRDNVVNNYPDRQRRVKTFMGVGYCAWCPKDYKKLIRALKYIHWAAKQEGPMAEKAQELLSRD